MTQIQQLYALQTLDDKIRAGRLRMGQVLSGQREPQALLDAKEKAAQIRSELQVWQTRQKELSLELGSIDDLNDRSVQRLYSGKVTNPKELKDLQHKVEMLARQKESLETDLLEALVAVEDGEASLSAAETTVLEMTTDWETSAAELRAEQQALGLELSELDAKRAAQAGATDGKALDLYARVGRQKHGFAVALLEGNKCLGCQVTVSSNAVKEAAVGGLAQCDSCGRLLYDGS